MSGELCFNFGLLLQAMRQGDEKHEQQIYDH
jgi:hypothetical protein